MTDTEYQCARCGSSLSWEPCEYCPACGWWDDFDPSCPACQGHGTVPFCMSSRGYCEAHPLPGRDTVARHTPEAFEVPVR